MTDNDPLPPPDDDPIPRLVPDDAVQPDRREVVEYVPAPEMALPTVGVEVPLPSPRQKPPHPGFWWAVLWMIFFVILTQGAVLFVSVIVILGAAILSGDPGGYLERMQQPDYVTSPEYARLLIPGVFVAQVLSILAGWLVLRLVAGRDWDRQVALRRPGLAQVVLTLLLLPILMLLGQGMVQLAEALKVPKLIDLETVSKLLANWPVWLGVLLIGCGAGVGEELWCRGFLSRGLVGRYGYVGGVLLTSLFFGLMHIEPYQVIYAPVMALLLHFVYLMTRSLWMPMLLHTLNNSLSVVQGGVPEVHDLELLKRLDRASTDPLGIPILYGGMIVAMLLLGAALYLCRTRLVAEDGSGEPPWQPPYPGVAHPPPGSGTVAVHPLPSPASLALMLAGVAVFVAACYLAIIHT
jgi:membrane protease YdiL (CAAX protease family)